MARMLTLPVLVAFGLFSSPARALPNASMQLFRVDGNGVKPLPAVVALLEASHSPSTVSLESPSALATPDTTSAAFPPLPPPPPPIPGFTASAQTDALTAPSPRTANRASLLLADAATPTDSKLLAQGIGSPAGLSVLSQQFVGPLPVDLSGSIRLVTIAEDGTLGSVVEEIPFTSTNIAFNADRTQLIVRPTSPIPPGQSVMMQLPSRSPEGIRFVYPNHLTSTPCIFKAPVEQAAAAPAAPAPPAPGGVPGWAIITGIVLVGVGVAAALGAFNGGGGGSSSTQVSQ